MTHQQWVVFRWKRIPKEGICGFVALDLRFSTLYGMGFEQQNCVVWKADGQSDGSWWAISVFVYLSLSLCWWLSQSELLIPPTRYYPKKEAFSSIIQTMDGWYILYHMLFLLNDSYTDMHMPHVCVIIIPSRLGWLQKTINICWRLGNHQLVHPLPTTIRKSFRHVRDPQDIFGYLCPLPQVTCAWRLAGTTWPMLLALVISARDGKIWPPGWLGVGWAETSTSTSILGHLGPGMKLETMNHHDAVIFFRWLPRVCVLNHQELVEKAHGATEQKGFPLKVQWWVGQNGKTWGDGEGHPWIMIYTLQWY